jgi:ATP-dependent DNA helicase RecG
MEVLNFIFVMMTSIELHSLIEQGEGFHLEFKESVSAKIRSEVVAFANAKGGRILIGVADDGKIVGKGIDNGGKSQIQDIARKCDPSVNIELEEVTGVPEVIVINVPEGADKPYRCTEGFYVRDGASSNKRTTQEIYDMFKDAGKFSFDDILAPSVDFDENFESLTLTTFLAKAKLSQKLPDAETVCNLDAGTMVDGKCILNNTGVLFFTENRDRFCKQAIIQCARFDGTKKIHIADQQDLTKDIITNIEDCFLFLRKHLNVGFDLTSGETRRKEIWEIPFPALKEAVVNSIAHRDYLDKGTHIQVFVFDDKVTINNFGGLFGNMTIDNLGTSTYRRNPNIVNLLHRSGYIEKMGTGILRINEELAKAGLPQAEFEADKDWFTITFKRKSLVTERPTDESLVSSMKLSEQDIKVLQLCTVARSREQILTEIKYVNEYKNFKRHVMPMVDNGLLNRTIPDKPKSSKQKYVTSELGFKIITNQ